MNVIIRDAVRDDMYQVCDLIKKLAAFEKMEDQVKVTPEILLRDGFNTDSPAFHCVVAEVVDGPLIGYAIYYTCFSTWLGRSVFLEDIYVDPAYRRCGIGKKLFQQVAKVAYETSKRLDFHVLSWNPAVEFYQHLGAINLSYIERWQLFRLDDINLENFVKPKE